MVRIGINGLGRIGRLALRIASTNPELNLVAIDDRNDLRELLPLIKRDSIYGQFPISAEAGGLNINGHIIPLLRSQSFPNWATFGADIVLECAGGNPDGLKARRHLELGAKYVIISAPAPNSAVLIMGTNHKLFDPVKHRIISMASCTTNCIATVLTPLKKFGLKRVYMDSINAYTNAQRIVDAPHGDPRRARAGAINIIPTESSTGADMAILFPELEFVGRAFRVPVACGSACSFWIEAESLLENINQTLELVSQEEMKGILGFTNEPLVSSDIIGDSHSALVDGLLTKVWGNRAHIVAWYDNELAYATRLCALAQYIGSYHVELS